MNQDISHQYLNDRESLFDQDPRQYGSAMDGVGGRSQTNEFVLLDINIMNTSFRATKNNPHKPKYIVETTVEGVEDEDEKRPLYSPPDP